MTMKKDGRRLLLLEDPSIQDRICAAIVKGSTNEHAANFAGIHVGTYYAWMDKGRESEDENNPYRIFYLAVKKAKAILVIKHLALIDKAAEAGTWQASAWKLERCGRYTINRTPEVEININLESIDTNNLINQLKTTEDLIKLQGPIIDIDEE